MVSIFVILVLFIVVFECLRHRTAIYDLLFFFNMSFLVYFGLAPLHILFGGKEYTSLSYAYENYGGGNFWTTFAICVSYLFVLTGYYLLPLASMGNKIYVHGIRKNIVYLLILIFMGLSFFSTLIYANYYGGIERAVTLSAYIRSGIETSDGTWLFLKKFIRFSSSSSILLIALILRKNIRWKQLPILILSFVTINFAFLGFTLISGRRSIIIYLAIIYFIIANNKLKKYILILLLIFFVSILVLFLGDAFYLGLYQENVMERFTNIIVIDYIRLYQKFWQDFTLPYMEAVGIVAGDNSLPRGFIDIPLDLLRLIPERMIYLKLPDSIVDKSTYLLTGKLRGEVAGVPPGFIGFLWYSGHIFGVIIGSFVYGIIGRFLNNILKPSKSIDTIYIALYSMVGFSWGYFLRMGSIELFIKERFHWVILILAIVFFSRITIKPSRQVEGYDKKIQPLLLDD